MLTALTVREGNGALWKGRRNISVLRENVFPVSFSFQIVHLKEATLKVWPVCT